MTATVTAVNSYDDSDPSEPGGVAKIFRVPDVPINFENFPNITTGTQIGLIWKAGIDSGGTPVIDYTIAYDQGNSTSTTYITLKAGVNETSYTAKGLTVGKTYRFIILARNDLGSS